MTPTKRFLVSFGKGHGLFGEKDIFFKLSYWPMLLSLLLAVTAWEFY
ncbi:MAG: hypothetical protein ACL93V_04100 [Candidatus Electrothrix sp. YB6]